MLNALDELESIFVSAEPQYDRLPPLTKKLVTDAQKILKENWDRVREGEPNYRRTKWGMFILAVAGAVYGVYRVICV